MKPGIALTLSFLATLGAANHEAVAYPAGTRRFVTPTVTDTVYYMALQRRLHDIPDPEETAKKLEATDALAFHYVANRARRLTDGGYAVRAAIEFSPIVTERAAKLYDLRIPLHDEKGYLSIYITSSLASAFCEDGSGASSKDLEVKLDDSSLTISVPVAQAVDFCRAFKEQHKSRNLPATPKTSSHGTEIAGVMGNVADDDVAATTTSSSKTKKSSPTLFSTAKQPKESDTTFTILPEGADTAERSNTAILPASTPHVAPELSPAVPVKPIAKSSPTAFDGGKVLDPSQKESDVNPVPVFKTSSIIAVQPTETVVSAKPAVEIASATAALGATTKTPSASPKTPVATPKIPLGFQKPSEASPTEAAEPDAVQASQVSSQNHPDVVNPLSPTARITSGTTLSLETSVAPLLRTTLNSETEEVIEDAISSAIQNHKAYPAAAIESASVANGDINVPEVGLQTLGPDASVKVQEVGHQMMSRILGPSTIKKTQVSTLKAITTLQSISEGDVHVPEVAFKPIVAASNSHVQEVGGHRATVVKVVILEARDHDPSSTVFTTTSARHAGATVIPMEFENAAVPRLKNWSWGRKRSIVAMMTVMRAHAEDVEAATRVDQTKEPLVEEDTFVEEAYKQDMDASADEQVEESFDIPDAEDIPGETQEDTSQKVTVAGLKPKKPSSSSEDDPDSDSDDESKTHSKKPAPEPDVAKPNPAEDANLPKSPASNNKDAGNAAPPKDPPANNKSPGDSASPKTPVGDDKSSNQKKPGFAPEVPAIPALPEPVPPEIPPPAGPTRLEQPAAQETLPPTPVVTFPTPRTTPPPLAADLASDLTFLLASPQPTPPPPPPPSADRPAAAKPPLPATPINIFTDLLSWNPACSKRTFTSSPTANPERTDVPKRVTEARGCWATVVPNGKGNADGEAGTTSPDNEPDKSSAAWGRIQDAKIRWTVCFLWGLAVLHVVFGCWEFGRSAWGWREVSVVPRVGWYVDEGVREATVRELPRVEMRDWRGRVVGGKA